MVPIPVEILRLLSMTGLASWFAQMTQTNLPKPVWGFFRMLCVKQKSLEFARTEARARFSVQNHVRAITAIYESFVVIRNEII